MRSTAITQASESTSITTASEREVPETRAPAQRRAEQIHHQEGGHDEIGFEHFDIEAETHEHRRQQQPAQAPPLRGLRDGPRASSKVSTSRLSIVLLRFVTTLIGVIASTSAANSPAPAPKMRRTRR